MKEIGSEFWNVPTKSVNNNVFPKSTHWYLSGRSALRAIIEKLQGCRSVAIPSWCCDSMIKPFFDAGIEIHFYPVLWNNNLIQDIRSDCDILFLIDYFGYSSYPMNLEGFNGVVIRDVTHSIFSSTYKDADYYFGSLRKWCGIWTGGYAWAQNGANMNIDVANSIAREYMALREKAMLQKEEFINGKRSDKGYIEIFDKAEKLLESAGIEGASERDIQLSYSVDSDFIKDKRRKNAEVIRTQFPEWLIFQKMNYTDCPMFVPVLVPCGKRDALRTHLIRNNIYCPIHWPASKYHELNEEEKFIYDNELSLVCDQRYTEEDMYHLVDTINNFWKEEA